LLDDDAVETELMARFARAVSDRYQVERCLGAGGMATVFLARDIKHGRNVALKVLRPVLAATIGLDRFVREIEVTARLDHPYVVPLLDSGEAEGLPYYTMPYVEGETLRARLTRDSRLSPGEAVQVARDVADALGYAHSRGIVHRDVKPENVFLSDGHARIADFGIARALANASTRSQTAPGIALGSPAYMSPEQAAGEAEVDQRSDVYALGCVLHEMLAGSPPFVGATADVVVRKHMTAQPPLIRDLRPDVPAALERTIVRALAKSRTARIQSASDFAAALGKDAVPFGWHIRRNVRRSRLTVAALGASVVAAVLIFSSPRPARTSLDPGVVAVLPFRVQAPDSSYNYLREGIVDLLNAQLTGGPVPRAVDSRSTLRAWRRAVVDAGGELTLEQSMAVARRLGAGRLLLGEVVATREQRTVVGRIFDAGTGRLVAEHSESGRVDELLLVHRLIGRLIAQSVGEGAARLPTLSDSLAAVKEYLAGIRDFRRAENTAARGHFTHALEIDSMFAAAALWWTLLDDQDVSTIKMGTERAWKLRDRLSERDRALLSGSFGIGPNYPAPSSMAEFLTASAYAARVNPDRAEVWYDFGSYMLVHGPQVYQNSVERATKALDSAIALDSTFGPAIRWRLEAAVAAGNRSDIRRFSALDSMVNKVGDQIANDLWVSAQALGDSTALAEVTPRFEELSDWSLARAGNEAVLHGFPLAAAEHAISRRTETRTLGGELVDAYLVAKLVIAAARGRVRDARAIESQMLSRNPGGTAVHVISLALAEPGYEGEAEAAFRALSNVVDTTQMQGRVCYHELWRLSAGDSTRTQQAIARYRKVLHDFPSEFANLGNYDVCPRLLAAMLERLRPTPRTIARDSIEAILLSGPGLDPPAEIATLMVARWRSERGEYREALTMVRRRPYIHNLRYMLVLPAHLREEGRLAAILGDTLGAIRAYRHFLVLRDRPDPGPMQEQVVAVRAELARLERGRRGTVALGR
jgi:serine/threonine-protein kinase